MRTREFLLLAIVFATMACGNGHGEDATAKLTREIEEFHHRMVVNINKISKAKNQTAAIEHLIAPFFTKDIVWTITSGTDITFPTIEWVGTCNPNFYAGYKLVATLAPVRFKLANVFFPDKYHAVYKYYVYSPLKGHKPFEIFNGYAVKSRGEHGKWAAQLVSVFEFRHAKKYL